MMLFFFFSCDLSLRGGTAVGCVYLERLFSKTYYRNIVTTFIVDKRMKIVAALLVTLSAYGAIACTTTGVTRGAQTLARCCHRSQTMVTGYRIQGYSKVPPMDHPPNSQRPVFPYIGDYPRFVGTARGSNNYVKEPGMVENKANGAYTPSSTHTWFL